MTWQEGPIFQNGPKSPVTRSKIGMKSRLQQFQILHHSCRVSHQVQNRLSLTIAPILNFVPEYIGIGIFPEKWKIAPFLEHENIMWKWHKVSKWIDLEDCSILEFGAFSNLGLGTWDLVPYDVIDVRYQSHSYCHSTCMVHLISGTWDLVPYDIIDVRYQLHSYCHSAFMVHLISYSSFPSPVWC